MGPTGLLITAHTHPSRVSQVMMRTRAQSWWYKTSPPSFWDLNPTASFHREQINSQKGKEEAPLLSCLGSSWDAPCMSACVPGARPPCAGCPGWLEVSWTLGSSGWLLSHALALAGIQLSQGTSGAQAGQWDPIAAVGPGERPLEAAVFQPGLRLLFPLSPSCSWPCYNSAPPWPVSPPAQ